MVAERGVGLKHEKGLVGLVELQGMAKAKMVVRLKEEEESKAVVVLEGVVRIRLLEGWHPMGDQK